MSTISRKTASIERRVTTRSIARRKGTDAPFAMLTAYDHTFARIFDQAGIDVLLVGDSVGNTVQGGESTMHVTLDEMIYHCRMVSRAARRALVVGDMPFGSYQVSPRQAVESAVRMVKEGGVQAVKLEGGSAVRESIARIVGAEIPVMGHVGLTPQSLHRMGGYRVQGRGERGREQVLRDAEAVADAGAFAVVLEGIPAALAREVTERIAIPTIGIGAGAAVDGQVLVLHDLLGLSEWTPGFARQYAELGALAFRAAQHYADDVAGRKFPDDEHSYD